MKKIAIFDIETDGIHATLIHCLSFTYYENGQWIKGTYTDYDDMRKFFTSFEKFAGHYIVGYDIPTCERILGIEKIDYKRCVDTLSICWHLYPEVKTPGLEYWGQYFSIPKIVVESWTDSPIELYKLRCETDVEINKLLLLKQTALLKTLYKNSPEDLKRLMEYKSFKFWCGHLQDIYKIKLDIDTCQRNLDFLMSKYDGIHDGLKEVMPLVEKKVKRNPPANPYKKDGTLSVTGQNWKDLTTKFGLPFEHDGIINEVVGYKQPNPQSNDQLKAWLVTLNWKPQTFKFSKQKDGSVKKVPQIKDGDELCESVLKLSEKHPQVKLLEDFTVIKHRTGVLSGFLRDQKDGYIVARFEGFTNTFRFKHKVIANLPKVRKTHNPAEGKIDYGDGILIRACLAAREGKELVGSDVSSLENQTRNHFIYPHDPGYVKDMDHKDFDSHTDLAVIAGFMTREEEQYFKDCKRDGILNEEVYRLTAIRNLIKQAGYSLVYGIGTPKLALALDISQKEAEKIKVAYWKRNWSVKKVASEQRIRQIGDQMWLFNPISKFWYQLRSEKDIFSTLNQGTGSYVFDTWLKHVLEKRPQLSMQMHDEGMWEIKLGHREAMEKILKDAMVKTNEELKLNVTINIDTHFGQNYAEIH